MKSKNYAVVDRSRCVACGECSHSCRKGAVSILNGCFASVNPQLCVGCGLCSKSCPADCITFAERKEL